MAQSPDLSNSITMHPHVFALQTYTGRPESTKSSHHSTPSNARAPFAPPDNAASTAYEPEELPPAGAEPVSRHLSGVTDIEGQRLPNYTPERDPYHLAAAYKSPAELKIIRANTSRKRDGCGPIAYGMDAIKARRVQGFYQTQNENIERLLKPVDDHVADARQADGDNHLKFQIAVYGSFIANVLLAGLQLYGAISSGSLSLFTTMADAIFDPMSNITLILTNHAVARVDPNRFPSGKARLETVGNIAFCFIMTSVSFILIALSTKELADGHQGLNRFHLPSVIAVAIAFVTKFALWIYCWALKDQYSQINILWQDHRNDLLINGFGILTSVGGAKLVWWIDPMGAILLSILIACIWLSTAFSEFMLLVGVTGPVDMHQHITYICVTHSADILGIDTVRCYHSGPRLIAEVDIVMNPEANLRATHDIAEELQMKLESLPDIERAYVHVDFETTHKPEHRLKKDL
ncbi:MAG: hypothetical protein M1818_006529 [Claussenomyces sp. TS43310]|nr:MAG: hypothetical protein M1818_006529 [Claussenomyces sp. TS43310]